MSLDNIRNFCIIAHIDHGKSTLADRLLEYTKTVPERQMQEQLLDQMDLERERGITIKLQPVTMEYRPRGQKEDYSLNLIDTPGHVDFGYEVSRSLAAAEGALLVVDATQGIQAQTLANVYLALAEDLTIIPVINKIDLPNADVAATKAELVNALGFKEDDIVTVSAKTGENIEKVLDCIINKIDPPQGDPQDPLQALVFDSVYDTYQGVIAYVRLFNGKVNSGDSIKMMVQDATAEVSSLGVFKPQRVKRSSLAAGQVGYIVTGLKDLAEVRVGETITLADMEATKPLTGYREPKPMVFAGIFTEKGEDWKELRKALEKLKLNDAALSYQMQSSQALGQGFLVGFLGLLHLDIVVERLKREEGLELVVTAPSVAYKVKLKGKNKWQEVRRPEELPPAETIEAAEEPFVKLEVLSPPKYMGDIMKLAQRFRAEYDNQEFLGAERVMLKFVMPLAELVTDFYDKLKSVTQGYGSMNYELIDYRAVELVRVDVLVVQESVEALAVLAPRSEAESRGRQIISRLKDIIPPALFEISLQAVIGERVVARENIRPRRKDVTAGLYGGDVTRKRKLLKKQAKGKKKLAESAAVKIPTAAFLAVLKRD